MTLNNVNFEAALKELYPGTGVLDLAFQQHALLGMLPKRPNFQGEAVKIPLLNTRPQNRSATFANAIAGNTNSNQTAFLITTVENYNFGFINNKTIEDSRSNKGAFVSALQHETDMAIKGLARDQNVALFGSSAGSRGQRGSVSGSTLTLASSADVVKFEIGMILEASPNADGSSARTGTITISAVDLSAGTFDFTGSITSFADNDYLFVAGDIGEKMSGLDAWLPAVAPTSGDNFFGVDRSVNPTRLAGVRITAAGSSTRDALIDGAIEIAQQGGGRPDVVVMNHLNYGKLLKELSSDAIFDKALASGGAKGEYAIAYSGVKVHGPTGAITVIPDRDCPVNVAYMLQLDTWELWSSGDVARIFDLDGAPMLRSQSFDGVEVRCFSYAQLACKAPGHNGRIVLPSV